MLERWLEHGGQPTADLLSAGYRYAHALDATGEEAEDLVHDAWLRLVHSGHSVPDKPLLFRAIRNGWIDHHRRRQRFARVSFDERDEAARDLTVVGVLDADAPDPSLQRALTRLRGAEREALFLMVVEGYTAEEVANLTDSVRGSVLSLVYRAKRKLREWMSAEARETASDRASDVACSPATALARTRGS